MPGLRPVNSRLGARSIDRPIEVFKPLAQLAANNAGNVSNKQQIYAKQQAMMALKPQGYDMEQRNLILKPPPRKKKTLPGTKLLIKLARERENDKIRNQYKSMINNDSMIEDITDDIMNDLM